MTVPLDPVQMMPCTCGRSSTGFCTGLHSLTNEQYDRMIIEGLVYPGELPKEDDRNES